MSPPCATAAPPEHQDGQSCLPSPCLVTCICPYSVDPSPRLPPRSLKTSPIVNYRVYNPGEPPFHLTRRPGLLPQQDQAVGFHMDPPKQLQPRPVIPAGLVVTLEVPSVPCRSFILVLAEAVLAPLCHRRMQKVKPGRWQTQKQTLFLPLPNKIF